MARFLSTQWVDGFNQAVADVELAPPGPDSGLAVRGGRFSMGQVVTGGPDGEVRTTLRVCDGRVSLSAGTGQEGTEDDVTIRLDWADAVALAAGALAPGEAIAAGRVRVRGDLSVLAEAQAVLGAVQEQLQVLRESTEY